MRIARTRRKKGGEEEKAPSFYIGYFGDSFWLTFSKLQVDIQSKSNNFAHKVEPKLNKMLLDYCHFFMFKPEKVLSC